MIYKITLQNIIKVLTGVVIYHIVFFAFYIYSINYLDNSFGVFTLIFIIHYVISIFPTAFLHIEYYLRNKGDIVEFNEAGKTITINNKTIAFNEIEKVIVFMPPVWHRGSALRLWPFEEYRYAKLIMKNGDDYFFTCLMGSDVDKIMTKIVEVPIEKKLRLVASTLIN